MKFSYVCLLVFLLSGIGHSVQAVVPDGRLFQSERAWLERFDSTLLSSRISSEFSWENNDAEADLFVIENVVRWGVPLGEDLAFGFQALQPLKWADGSEEEAAETPVPAPNPILNQPPTPAPVLPVPVPTPQPAPDATPAPTPDAQPPTPQ